MSIFNDEEFISLISFSEHKLVILEVEGLEAINQLHFLRFLQWVEQFDIIEESTLHSSLVNARLNDDSFEDISIQDIGCALFQCFDARAPLVIVKQG